MIHDPLCSRHNPLHDDPINYCAECVSLYAVRVASLNQVTNTFRDLRNAAWGAADAMRDLAAADRAVNRTIFATYQPVTPEEENQIRSEIETYRADILASFKKET